MGAVSSIMIGALRYNVSVVSMNDFSEGGYRGTHDGNNTCIRVSDRISREAAAHTLLHEIMHAIENVYAIRLGERNADLMATAIAQLIRDNPELIDYLEDTWNRNT